MVGDVEQQSVYSVKRELSEASLISLLKSVSHREFDKPRLAKDVPLLESRDDTFSSQDEGRRRKSTRRCAVNRVAFFETLTEELPEDDVAELSPQEEEVMDPHMTDGDRAFKLVDAVQLPGSYEEFFHIYGINFWEELGQLPMSTFSPPSGQPKSYIEKEDQPLFIGDDEALEKHLLTKTFLKDL